MKKSERFIAFALCFTLTLGAFAYRPPQAKAVAAEASALSALLYMWMSGAGVQFTNSGLDSSAIADALNPYIVEFEETVKDKANSFVEWLGYDSYTDLVKDIPYIEHKVFFPRPVAIKLNEFTGWLIGKLGTGDVPLTSGAFYASVKAVAYENSANYTSFDFKDGIAAYFPSGSSPYGSDPVFHYFYTATTTNYTLKFLSVPEKTKFDVWGTLYPGIYVVTEPAVTVSVGGLSTLLDSNMDFISSYGGGWNKGWLKISEYVPDVVFSAGAAFVVSLVALKELPEVDEGTGDVPVSVNSDAADLAALLEELLEKIAANEALDISVDTDTTGGETGDKTEDDAKPYLPYIPKIFERIGELPGLIAEKIGAFFTTLWGWLQKIIDAIVSVPAAVAEKVGELFKPDEALVTEITDTFKEKFGFLPTLKRFGDDLFGMTAETEPPVVWIHLENAESKYGYIYGNKTKALDLTWYQKYKANVDTIVSGFLWLAFLWLLFKRASSIIQGGEMIEQYTADISAGHREKGGKKK